MSVIQCVGVSLPLLRFFKNQSSDPSPFITVVAFIHVPYVIPLPPIKVEKPEMVLFLLCTQFDFEILTFI